MKQIFLIFITTFFCFTSYGQNSLVNNIWPENKNYYNVAASGLENSEMNHSASFYAKHKFLEMDADTWKKPNNYMFNVVGKFEKLKGVLSAGYLYDGQSFYDRHSIYGGYGYDLSLGGLGKLTLGARLIVNYDKRNWDKFYMGQPENSKSSYVRPDFDLGVQYKLKGLTVGLSTKNIAKSNVKVLDSVEVISNHNDWYGNVSYDIKICKFWATPYIFVYQHRKTGIDAGLNLSLRNKFDLGYAFRIKELRHIVSARVNVYKGFCIGAAIDTKGLYSDNNLDLLVGYAF